MLNILGVCLGAMMMCRDISVHTSLQAFGTRFFVALLPAVHISPVVVYYYFLAELEQILVDILGLSGNVVAQDTFGLSEIVIFLPIGPFGSPGKLSQPQREHNTTSTL